MPDENQSAVSPTLDFVVRVPKAWEAGVPENEVKTFCSDSIYGEYAIQRGSNGRFAVLLDGVPLTGFAFQDAVQAMSRANLFEHELAAHIAVTHDRA